MVALPPKLTLKITGNAQCDINISAPDKGNNQIPSFCEFCFMTSRLDFNFDRSAKPGNIDALKALANKRTKGNSRAPNRKTAKWRYQNIAK